MAYDGAEAVSVQMPTQVNDHSLRSTWSQGGDDLQDGMWWRTHVLPLGRGRSLLVGEVDASQQARGV